MFKVVDRARRCQILIPHLNPALCKNVWRTRCGWCFLLHPMFFPSLQSLFHSYHQSLLLHLSNSPDSCVSASSMLYMTICIDWQFDGCRHTCASATDWTTCISQCKVQYCTAKSQRQNSTTLLEALFSSTALLPFLIACIRINHFLDPCSAPNS